MKKLILLTGLSGSGKSHYRKEMLTDLPHVDMGEIRLEKRIIQWDAALAAAFYQILELFKTNDTVVLEGYFLPRSTTRQWVERFCRKNSFIIDVRHFEAPRDERIKRVMARQDELIANAKSDDEIQDIQIMTKACMDLIDYNPGGE